MTEPTMLTSEPNILTANCYYWKPGMSADQRRRAESKRQGEVKEWFEKSGLVTTRTGDTITAVGSGIEVDFHYSESCANVYKYLNVWVDGKKSNILGLRKWLKQNTKHEIHILS